MDIAILGDADAVVGFKLAGVMHGEVFDEAKAGEIMEKYKEAKILVATENVAQYLREKKLNEKIQGVLIEIPDKTGSKGYAIQEISKLFESAVGVQLKK